MVCLLRDSRGPVQIRNGRAGNTTRVLQESQDIRKPGRSNGDADGPRGRTRRYCYSQAVCCGGGAVEFHGVGAGRGAEVLPLNGYGLSDAALRRAESKNRQRVRRGGGSLNTLGKSATGASL